MHTIIILFSVIGRSSYYKTFVMFLYMFPVCMIHLAVGVVKGKRPCAEVREVQGMR